MSLYFSLLPPVLDRDAFIKQFLNVLRAIVRESFWDPMHTIGCQVPHLMLKRYFRKIFAKLEAKARRSVFQRLSENKTTSFGFELCFGLWKMPLQVGWAVTKSGFLPQRNKKQRFQNTFFEIFK